MLDRHIGDLCLGDGVRKEAVQAKVIRISALLGAHINRLR